jgi:hypothetical protein
MNWSPLEQSFGILMSLFISIKQNFNSILYYEDHLSNESEYFKNSKIPEKSSSQVDTTIIDALRFQFILQVCSFLDEWDKFTGIKTSSEFDEKIRVIKRVVKPAKQAINKFPDLKRFRNEIIAHNYRDKNNEFTFNRINTYHIPNSNGEMYLILYCLKRMLDVLYANFPEESSTAHQLLLEEFKKKPVVNKVLEEDEINKKIEELEQEIDNRIWDIARFDINKAMIDGINSHFKDKK